jgi:hypothetical protein
MAVMSATGPGTPRRLERPPSDRFREPEAASPAPAQASLLRAVLVADGVALAGAALTVLLGGVLALSAGLLVLWLSLGSVLGQLVRSTAGSVVTPAVRVTLAVGSALLGVVLGQVGLWLYAGVEGGALPLIDYLAQTYGVLVPLQAVLAAVAAWWKAR